MRQAAKTDKPAQPWLEYGFVQEEKEGIFRVETEDGHVRAEQAASCFLKPQPGDSVLLTWDAADNGYILAVLRRNPAENRPYELVFDGQVQMTVKNGGLTMDAERDLSLRSEAKVACLSKEFSLEAHRGEVTIGRVSFLGEFIKTQVRRIEVLADLVENIFSHLTQRLISSSRYVAEHEEVQTGSTRYLVEDHLSMQAKEAEHLATEIIRITSKEIHLT